MRERWGWRDSRTGKPVSMSGAPSKETAEWQLEAWRARDRKGGRPDIHDLIPFIEVYREDEPTGLDS